MGTEHKLTIKLLSDAVEAGVRVQRGWWHEVVYRFPRSVYKLAAAEAEMKSSGVYFLLGEMEGKPSLYVGQTTNLGARFAQHAVDGSKGFWQDTLVLTTSGGATLDEAHLKYLENHFYCIASEAGRCTLTNSSVPPESVAVDAIRQDMEECIAHTRLLLNLMGYHFLEKQPEGMEIKPQPEKKPALPQLVAEPVMVELPQRLAGDVVCRPSAPRAKIYDFYEMGLKDGDVLVYEDADPTHRMEVTVCGSRLISVKDRKMTPHKLVKAIRKVNNVYAFDYLSRNGEKLRYLYDRTYHGAGQGTEAENPANLRYFTVAGADAVGRLTDDGGIIVLKGSRICAETKNSCLASAVALRQEVGESLITQKDYAFKSLSGAAQFVGGCSLNGKLCWTETKKLPKPHRKKA